MYFSHRRWFDVFKNKLYYYYDVIIVWHYHDVESQNTKYKDILKWTYMSIPCIFMVLFYHDVHFLLIF